MKLKYVIIIFSIFILILSIMGLREWTHFWEARGNFELKAKGYVTLNVDAYCHPDFQELIVLRKYPDYREIIIIPKDIGFSLSGKTNRFYSFCRKHLW